MSKQIFSYNVNGIRAAITKGFISWLKDSAPDIICLQETKASPDQLDTDIFKQLGYHTYWFSALKKGYSSVAVFSKTKPDNIFYGLGINKYDFEGRTIRVDFGDTTLINSYFPSGTTDDIRQDFKMNYLSDFKNYIDKLKIERPKIIISGDFNICHKPIDINHPERHKNSSGFLPEERVWMDQFLESGFVDTFREFNKNPDQYSWWSYRAGSRNKNLGWRIDYHLISKSLRPQLIGAEILNNVKHSDHCPVKIDLEF
ncbi:MAG: exodeoxyribonuclease III [Bacteroidales bacterium]